MSLHYDEEYEGDRLYDRFTITTTLDPSDLTSRSTR